MNDGMIDMSTMTIPDPDGRTSGIPHHTAEPGRYYVTVWDRRGRIIGKPYPFSVADDYSWFEWHRPKRIRKFMVRFERGPFTCRYLADPAWGDGTWSCAHCGQSGGLGGAR